MRQVGRGPYLLIRRQAIASLLILLIVSLLLPAAAAAAVPVANDDPTVACSGGTNWGGNFPIPEDYRKAGPFGEWSTFFGQCALLVNDVDPDGDPLTYDFVTLPAHGQVLKIDEEFFAYQVEPDYSTIAGDQPGGTWLSDSFTYEACDATTCSAPATVRFWIAPINDPPTFTAGPSLVEVDEDSGAYSGAWATDISSGPANESAQTVHFDIVSLDVTGVPDMFAVDPAISSSGVLTFTPGPGQYGLAHVTVRAKDDGGLSNFGVSDMLVQPDDTSDEVTFEIVVYPVVDPVVAVDDVYAFDEDPWIHYLDLFANDLNQDDADPTALSIEALTEPSLGTIEPVPGGVIYKPFANANGTDTFDYTVSNGDTTDVGTVSITINPTEDPPVAEDDTLAVSQDTGPTAVDVLLNDRDIDEDPLEITSAADPAHGTVEITGGGAGLTYRPDAGFAGPDTFDYTISDGFESDTATVSVTVVPKPGPDADVAPPVAWAPVARLPGQTVGNQTTTARISWSATDADSGITGYRLQVSVDGGSWSTIALPTPTTAAVTRTLTVGHAYRFRVRATDGAGNVGAYAMGPSLAPLRYAESSTRITYVGSWKKTTSPKAFGGGARHATSSTRRATFAFTGYDVGWIATRTSSSGMARVYVDGILVATVDLGQVGTAYRKLVFARHFPTLGAHTFAIQPVGDGRVDIDGFVILR